MKTTMTITSKQKLNEANFKFMNEVFGAIYSKLTAGLEIGLFNVDNVDTLFEQILKESYDKKVVSKLAEFSYLVDESSFPSFDEFIENNFDELNKVLNDIKDFLKAA